MNTIEEQLTGALHRRDADLTVRDELDAIINNDHIVRFTSQRQPRSSRPLLLTAAAATMLVVGAGFVAINRPATTEQPAAPAAASQPEDDPPQTTPSTVLEATDPDNISAQAQAWFSAVDTVIDDLEWDLPNPQQIPGEGVPFGASVYSEIAGGRVVFDVQSFAPGVYSDDPTWQSGIAGTNEPGTPIAEGTLFIDDQLSRSATIVTPQGIVMVMAYDIPSPDLPAPDVFVDSARRLATVLPDVLAAVSLFPDDLEVLPLGDCRTESSTQEVVATMQRNNGNTLRLFTTQASPDAPVNGHALIETTSDGQSVGGSSDCNPPGTPLESGALWVNAPSESSADGVFVWLIGQAPAPSTRVEVALSDGATVNIDLQTDGYFIGEVVRPGVETGPDASAPPFPQPTSIKAFDADGNLVQERDQ